MGLDVVLNATIKMCLNFQVAQWLASLLCIAGISYLLDMMIISVQPLWLDKYNGRVYCCNFNQHQISKNNG